MGTYASMMPRQQQQSLRLLKDLQPLLLFNMFGERDTLNQRTGNKGVFRMYYDLPALESTVGDGEVAVTQEMSSVDKTVRIVSFRSKIPVTKDQQLYHEDDLIAVGKDKITRQLARTDDKYAFKVLRAGTSVRYAGTATQRTEVVTAVTRADLDLAVRDLQGIDVPQVTKKIAAGMNVDTEPVKASYVAICHPHLAGDLTRTTGWIPAEKYASDGLLHPAELGASPAGIRFLPSTVIEPWLLGGASSSAAFLSGGVAVSDAAACDVYPILIFGEGWYGHLDLKDYTAMEVNTIVPGSKQAKTVSDPTGENGCVAGDLKTGVLILDERRGLRLEVACSKTWS